MRSSSPGLISRWHRPGDQGIPGRCAVALVGLLIASCGSAADVSACQHVGGSDRVLLDGTQRFDASFAEVQCESAAIDAGDVVDSGSLTIIAPSPGFDEDQLVAFVTDSLEPAGLTPTAVHYYVLSDDRATIARLGVIGSLADAFEAATRTLQDSFAEDGRPGATDRVAYVLQLETGTIEPDLLVRAIETLRDSDYAFLVGKHGTTIPPPIDPARDRSSAEIPDSGGSGSYQP